jgi:nitrogen fixation protein FixH
MKAGMGWPIGVLATLSVLVGAYVWLAVIANDPHALVVEPDYYQRGVHFDDAMEQARVNARLGWVLAPTLGPVSADSGAVLGVTLLDATGASLDSAAVAVTAVHNAIADQPVTVALAATGPGTYEARIGIRRAGAWELRFDVQRGSARFTRVVRLDAAGAPGS